MYIVDPSCLLNLLLLIGKLATHQDLSQYYHNSALIFALTGQASQCVILGLSAVSALGFASVRGRGLHSCKHAKLIC